jgi:predicted transcriptional regulator of viral defense system
MEDSMSAFVDQHLIQRLRAEYIEMPGMRLTIEQVRRLCGIDAHACKVVLESLVKAGFLYLLSDGSYARLTEGDPAQLHPAKANVRLLRRPAARRAS